MIDLILTLCQEALWISIIVSMPAILVSLIIGLIVAIFSATTQIQEQTLSFAPKIIAVYVTLIIFAAPLGSLILNFTQKCFSEIFKVNN